MKRKIASILALVFCLSGFIPSLVLAEQETVHLLNSQSKIRGKFDPNLLTYDKNQVNEPEEIQRQIVEEQEKMEVKRPTQEGIQENIAGDQLQMSSINLPRAVQSPGQCVEISSFEELKAQLVKSEAQKYIAADSGKRLFLKSNNYQLVQDITIDLGDPFFADKFDYIKNGILSFGNSDNDSQHMADSQEFIFDGKGHTITIKPAQGKKALPLFGGIISGASQIKNLNLVIEGNVVGYPFADLVSSMQSEDDNGYTVANGLVENINVTVNGSVVPQIYPWEEANKRWPILGNNDFAGNFTGAIATGFGIKMNRTNLNNIKVDITGDIGSASPETLDNTYKQRLAQGNNYSAGAFGFLWCSEDADYYRDKTSANTWTRTRTDLFKNGDYKVLRKCGYIENIDIKVGGSILATGYDNAYASGFMDSSDNSWVDKVKINIGGDIKTVLKGGTEGTNTMYGNEQMTASYAVGFAESLTNFTNSELSVNNLLIEVSDDYQKQVNGKEQNLVTSLCGIGYDSGSGNLIRLVNNKVNIRGKMEAKTPLNLIANAGFYNTWNSNSRDGVNWAHFFEDNKITIGEINLRQSSDSVIQYYGFGEKFRTGTLSDREKKDGYKELEEVSAKNNTLKIDKLSISNQRGSSLVYPSFYNAANAKNNDIEYKEIVLVSRDGVFSGLGNIINDEPKESNGIVEITEKNRLNLGDVTVAGVNFDVISLGAKTIDSGKTMRGNEIKAGDVIVKLGGFNRQEQLLSQNSGSLYFGGLVSNRNHGIIDDNHLFIKGVDILNTSNTFFGLGAARNDNQIKNSTVLIDRDVDIRSIGTLYEGLFTGFSAKGSIDNCHAQINGNTSLGVPQGVGMYFGSFGGWLNNTDVKNSSALMFNGYSPFAFYMDGGSLDGVANYSDEGNWKFFSGLLASSSQNNRPTIKNSTYIVDKVFEYRDQQGNKQEKNNENSIVYRDDNVSAESTNNYIVLVGQEGKDKYNRIAYKLKKRKATVDEMGQSIPEVWAKGKNAEPFGQINIAGRSFQDKYWGDKASEYQLGDPEKDFVYMDQNPDGLKIQAFGRFTEILKSGPEKGSLKNYSHRHVGLALANGPIYDLLGIKGYPAPSPEPNPDQPSKPDSKPNPEPNSQPPAITWRGLWHLGNSGESKEMEIGRHYKYLYGYVDKTVRPEGMITRSEAAALIARLAELDMTDKTKPNFKDTPSAWYNSAINIMVKKDLMFGDKNGNFRPNEPITRGEFARALYYIDKKNDKVAPFADVKGHEFEAAINQAYGNDRIAGYPDGSFKPNAYIQRAEAVRILNQYANRNVNIPGMEGVKKDLIRFTDINENHWAYCEVMEAANSHEYQRAKGSQVETWLRILDIKADWE